jgi:hypothetical protein
MIEIKVVRGINTPKVILAPGSAQSRVRFIVSPKIVNLYIERIEKEDVIYDGEKVVFDGEQVVA